MAIWQPHNNPPGVGGGISMTKRRSPNYQSITRSFKYLESIGKEVIKQIVFSKLRYFAPKRFVIENIIIFKHVSKIQK